MMDLARHFGQIDIYLFDQLLRGRIRPPMRVLDAGCGDGRNLVYLLRAGYDVFGVDADARAVRAVRELASRLAPSVPADNFSQESIQAMTFPQGSADVVVCSAVLHFAGDDGEFMGMVQGCWRALRPGGMLFCRLASTIGMADRMVRVAGRRFRLPDGTERYLVDEPMLLELTAALGGDLLDPLKTSVVQDQRCMTTWVVRK